MPNESAPIDPYIKANPVLFLDFDGVLHHAAEATIDGKGEFIPNERLFCWRTHLETLLEEHPAVRILISSDWRKYHAEDDLAGFLGEKLAQRMLGVMPYFERGSRAEAIQAEAARMGLHHWLALDDHASVHAARENGDDRFLACDSESGLDCEMVRAETASKLRWLSWLAAHSRVAVVPIRIVEDIPAIAPA